jgi:hypothetical protein
MEEQYVRSTVASGQEYFLVFGLTDVVILHAAREAHLVLTDDASLYQLLEGLELPCINFSHLRSLNT